MIVSASFKSSPLKSPSLKSSGLRSSGHRIAVIGAGIAGITTAYKLVRAGHDVTVFDRNRYAAMETSFANGGQLSASNAEVWNSVPTLVKGLKWMFSPGAPLFVSPKPSWHKLSWMAEFLAAIPRHDDNTVTTARMAIAARQHLRQMADDENIAFDCENRGILHFYSNKRDFQAGERTSGLLARAGLNRRSLTAAEVREIEPTLKGEIYGGFYTESDFSGDIHRFTTGLADACARHGALLRFGRAITHAKADANGVTLTSRCVDDGEVDAEHFDRIVVCSGVGSRAIAAQFGDRLNVYPVKGYSVTVKLDTETSRAAAPWVSLLDDEAKIVASRLGEDRFRIAGTAEFSGANTDIRAARIKPLVDWCHRWMPGIETRDVTPWAGLRPMMPDMMPRVMQGRIPTVFYNTGHGHLGWTLSAITADMVTGLIADGDAAPRTTRARGKRIPMFSPSGSVAGA
jgi:D-amino-acid dehydrogenase